MHNKIIFSIFIFLLLILLLILTSSLLIFHSQFFTHLIILDFTQIFRFNFSKIMILLIFFQFSQQIQLILYLTQQLHYSKLFIQDYFQKFNFSNHESLNFLIKLFLSFFLPAFTITIHINSKEFTNCYL